MQKPELDTNETIPEQAGFLTYDNFDEFFKKELELPVLKLRLDATDCKKKKERTSRKTTRPVVSSRVYTESELLKLLEISAMTLWRWRNKAEEIGDSSIYPPYKFVGERRVYSCDLFEEWLNVRALGVSLKDAASLAAEKKSRSKESAQIELF